MIDGTSVPEWVPRSVLQMATAMELGTEIRIRLLTDPRMKSVWRVLQSAGVDKAVFAKIDPQQLLSHWGINDFHYSANDQACAAFFACILVEATIANPPVTQMAVKKVVQWWREGAKRCRIALQTPGRARVDLGLAKSLTDAEKYFEEMARYIEDHAASNPNLLKRSSGERGEDAVRAIVRAVARGTLAIFGGYLYGTLATAVTVAMGLNEEINPESVKNWCATLPRK